MTKVVEIGHMDVGTAEATAARELEALPTRLAHVRAVAELARLASEVLPPDERSLLISAAYLHDIGYAPRLVRTGFHPLDGAYWLQAEGELRLASLVAHHSGALYEARNRGLEGEMAAFAREDSLVADLLTWCDLNRGPQGQPVSVSDRLQNVADRYGPDHVVPRSLAEAEPELVASCKRVERLLTQVK